MDVRSLLVLFRVACDAEISEVCHDFFTYERAVLADACCESDHINAVHGCCIRADILGNSVAECVYGQFSVLVAAKISLFQIAEVRGEAVGQSEDAGLLVEDVDYLRSSQVLFACDEINDRRIEVAASGAHMLAPLPRWQTIVLQSSYALPATFAASLDTKEWLVPWKPYLLIL